MCRYYPVTSADMRNISGVGDAKLERYGEYFIREIQKYLDDNPDISASGLQPAHSENRPSDKKKKGETVEKTYELYREGLSLEDISKQRNLAPSTIAVHLERLIQNGYDIDIRRFVDTLKRQKIEELFLKLRQWTLSPVIENSNGTVSYEEARLVRAYMLNRGRD
jgi:ATP-dependent DNA helicase RecQ